MPDAIKLLSHEEKIKIIKIKEWCPIVYSWDLLKFDKKIRKGKSNIGKNTKIYGDVKNSSIGDNCIIKGNVKNSIVMDNTIIGKGSIVKDSVIGRGVYFQGRIISKSNIYSIIKNKKIKVDRLGAIIADNVRADNVVINAGCKIWPNKSISNKIVKEDII